MPRKLIFTSKVHANEKFIPNQRHSNIQKSKANRVPIEDAQKRDLNGTKIKPIEVMLVPDGHPHLLLRLAALHNKRVIPQPPK
jgi:hypothetical protein